MKRLLTATTLFRMTTVLFIIIWANILTQAQSAPIQPPHTPSQFAPGEIIVKFKDEVPHFAAQSSLQTLGLQTRKVSPKGGWLVVEVVPGYEAETIEQLSQRGDVEFAEYNYYVYATDAPNDPQFFSQWNLYSETRGGIDALGAWDLSTGAGSIKIAILDSGIDLEHPDLTSKVVNEYSFVDGNQSVQDDHEGHGTHVAGIAAAIGNNEIGVAGINWQAQIMPLKVLDSEGKGKSSEVAEAIYWAIDNGAKVINMSLSLTTEVSQPSNLRALNNALRFADGKKVLVVVSAGNDDMAQVGYPANSEYTMAVSAITNNNELVPKANYGTGLDVVAPGLRIQSTLAQNYEPSGYGTKSGTSMAAPHVTGLASLIWSVAPNLTHTQVRELIIETADDIGDPGYDQIYGYGKINAYQALKAVVKFDIELEKTKLLFDDHTLSQPTTLPVTIKTLNPNPVAWSAKISPEVSWATITPSTAISGTVSAESPSQVNVTVAPPTEHGVYTTTLVIEGDAEINTTTTEITVQYVPQLTQTYLPYVIR